MWTTGLPRISFTWISLGDLNPGPDELVDFGVARSRASVIERALLRELRYQRMLQEVEILNSGIGADEDLDALARFSGNVALDVD